MKAAFAAFVEAQMPLLQQANPGLKRSQLLERLRKQFAKSVDNPVYQQQLHQQENQ